MDILTYGLNARFHGPNKNGQMVYYVDREAIVRTGQVIACTVQSTTHSFIR